MNCPVCKDVKLVISDRNGIEIDYCPDCRGIWLDRGELDKIIDRSTQAEIPEQNNNYQKKDKYYDDDDHYKYNQKHDNKYDPRKKKRGGFLEDLFDF